MKNAASSFVLMASAIAVGIGLAGLGPAIAETDADLSKYCRVTFANSAPTTRASGGQRAHYCNQSGTLQGIDLARACELTTGSGIYRMVGDRVLCEDGPGPSDVASSRPLGADDFVRYCRMKFPNSLYQDVPDASGGRPHCRRAGATGGFTLQPVDIADACDLLSGGGGYREENGKFFCTRSVDNSATTDRQATAAGGGPAEPEAAADPPTSERSDNREPESADSGTAGGSLDDREQADGSKAGGGSDDERLTDDGGTPGGTWEMTAGVLIGMKVRLAFSDLEMKGVIAELPPGESAETARTAYGLSVGDVVFVGRLVDGELNIRTRLGVLGTPEWVNANCPNPISQAPFNKSVSERWGQPGSGWYPVYGLRLDSGEISGRHNGFELLRPTPQFNGECFLNNAPFHPDAVNVAGVTIPKTIDPSIRLPELAVRFELKLTPDSCKRDTLTAAKGGDDSKESVDEEEEPQRIMDFFEEEQADESAEELPLRLQIGPRGLTQLDPPSDSEDGEQVTEAEPSREREAPDGPLMRQFEMARAFGKPVTFFFWTDAETGFTDRTTQQGRFGPRNELDEREQIRNQPEIDEPTRRSILHAERTIRSVVEDGHLPGATLLFDDLRRVTGVRVPAESVHLLRPYIVPWDRASLEIIRQDPNKYYYRPWFDLPGIGYEEPPPPSDRNTLELEIMPPAAEQEPPSILEYFDENKIISC